MTNDYPTSGVGLGFHRLGRIYNAAQEYKRLEELKKLADRSRERIEASSEGIKQRLRG